MSERAETITGQVDPDALLIRPEKNRTQRLGRRLVSHFYLVAKTAGMFDFTNVNAREAVGTFLRTVTEALTSDPQVSLQVASDCVFVNETRLKIDFEGFASFKYIVEAFADREVGAILLSQGVDEESLSRFLELWVKHDGRTDEPRESILSGLRAVGVTCIDLDESRELPDDLAKDASEDHRDVSLNTYFKAIFVAKQFMEDLHGSRARGFQKARRLTHSIVDIVTQDESTLMALTQIKNFDNFLFTHSANVCVLSISLGQSLGLDKGLLGALGLAGLTHDVGMMDLPRGMLERRDTLDAEERRVFERHASLGVKAILKGQGVSEVSIRGALVAFEHHLNDDLSGFPRIQSARSLSLLSRIVAICDFYDTVTTPTSEAEPTFAPEEALRLMAHEGNDVFDPLLVKVFINAIGTYPLGTLVRLDTGEVGVIHQKNPHFTQHNRPIVKLIADEYGMPIPPVVVDLNEWDREHDRFRRSIERTIPPHEYFEEIQDFTDLL